MLTVLKSLLGNKSGVTVIEYALIAALIGIIATATIQTIGQKVNDQIFSVVANGL
jgi:Flp pilus assembly pilin Flp